MLALRYTEYVERASMTFSSVPSWFLIPTPPITYGGASASDVVPALPFFEFDGNDSSGISAGPLNAGDAWGNS